MNMVINKAIIISKEINVAQCKGNWQAIPELARRYKKHNPGGIVLEQSILAQAKLQDILQTHRIKESKNKFERDSPNAISLSTRVDPNLMRPIQQQIATALGDKHSSAETSLYKQMAKIILAQSYFESGEYTKAIEAIGDAHYNQPEKQQGYSYTLYLQALSIKAMSYDLLEKNQEALKEYRNLVSIVNATSNLTDRVIVDWAEEGLYRGTLLALSDSQLTDVPTTMNLIRAYQKSCSSQLNTWRICKRLVVTKYSLEYLSNIYRAEKYLPPVDYSLTEEGKQMSETEFPDACRAYNYQLFSIEIIQLHTIYEKLVYSVTHFPRSGQTNTVILDFVNQLAADFQLIFSSETEKRGYVEALNRASTKTFNSPCVTRHLFHALVSLGDYEEAQHALRTYLYLVGLESKSLLDARTTTFALASDNFGFNIPVPSADEVEELAVAEQSKKLDGPRRSEEVETAENKISVLAVAVKMYCQELSRGADAVTVAELAERVYNIETEKDEKLVAQIYRMLGASFGFLASQTFDQERRPQYHKKALSSLRKSLEMDKSSWQTYYQMALQLAEMRDIYGAIPMISKSLQLNSSHLPSWHLLALLCTCPTKDNLNQALKICELALNQESFDNNWVDYSDKIAQQVLLQMTHTLLVERVQGTEAALIAQENLFQLFGKIVVPELIPDAANTNMLHEAISNGNARYGMVLSGSLGNLTPPSSDSLSSNEKIVSTRNRSSSSATSVSKAKSVSSFTGRKFHLAEMFKHPPSNDASSVRSVPVKSSSQHHKSLLGRKKSFAKKGDSVVASLMSPPPATTGITKTGSLTSLLSTTSMMSTTTLLQPQTLLTRPTTHARLQHQHSCKMMVDLWLLSAEAFLKWGKLEEALKAVGEAENVDWTTHAGVWCVLGRIRLAQRQYDQAIAAFQKGLVTKPNDVSCRVWLAKTYLELSQLEVAEGMLVAVTQENGWDCPAAWFYLGEIYKQTDRIDRTKDCLFYALELESTTPIQPFTILPRIV